MQAQALASFLITDTVCNINIEYKSKIVHRKYKQQIPPYLSLREHNLLHR